MHNGTAAQPRDKPLLMAESAPRKKRSRLGARFQLEINFPDEESKKQFLSRLDRAKNATSSDGCPKVDNYSLLSMLLDRFEEADSTGDAALVTTSPAENRSMLKHSGNVLHFLVY